MRLSPVHFGKQLPKKLVRPRASTASADDLPVIPESIEPDIDEEAQKRLRLNKGLCDDVVSPCGESKVSLCFCTAFTVASVLVVKLTVDFMDNAC